MRTFRDFMESSLYDPETGYYPNREKTEDFYTAPELHPAFGAVLGDRLAVLLDAVAASRPNGSLVLAEAGCGDGTLACQVARRLREKRPELAARLRFALIERNRKDLTTAARRLTAFGVPVEACTDIARLPSMAGVLYSNELLDALPVHLLEKFGGEVREVFVDAEGKENLAPLSTPALAADAAAVSEGLPEGGRHAVALEARAWITTAAQRLLDGYVLTVDYGKRFSPEAPNPPRAFRRHAIETELTRVPGGTDLTASVDFDAMIRVGEAAGLGLISYDSLSRFLIDGGIETFLAAATGDNAAAYKERAQLKTLVHPEGMGEAFKVLIQRKEPRS